MEKTMTIEKFGQIIDGFLKENEIQMLITLPEESMEADIQDNVNMGSVIQFYIFLHAFPAIFWRMQKDLEGSGLNTDPEKMEDLVDHMLAILKKEVLEEAGNR